MINQGEVYWVDFDDPDDPEHGFRRPHVVLQNNAFNHSRIETVIVCPLTSNLRRATAPGNVLLGAGEANLPKPSVVNVAQIFTLHKTQLGDLIGALSLRQLRRVLRGIALVLEPREPDR